MEERLRVEPVLAMAKEAGAAIIHTLNAGIHIESKADASPVTEADRKADTIIKRGLKQLNATIPILSEEDTPEERKSAQASRYQWVIDPLDGTRTAIGYANGERHWNKFGVHIALLKDGVPILGVAYFPAMNGGTAYYTGNDGKAYMQAGDTAPKPIRVSKPPFRQTISMAVSYDESRRLATIAGRNFDSIPGIGGQRICMAAEGQVDLADLNDIASTHRGAYAYKQWDLAAAHAILKAAGGELVDAETKQPVTYDRPDFTLPGCYAGGVDTLKLLGLGNLPPIGRVKAG